MEEEHPFVQLARRTIETYVRFGRRLKLEEALPVPTDEPAGAFVTLHRRSTGELRGCIGTIQPTEDMLAQEIINNAISAATRDPRFPPVSANELDDLIIDVSVLYPPEAIDSIQALDPKTYGVIVQCGWRRGLLLPSIDGIDDTETQVRYARMKGGISPDAKIDLYRFKVEKYV